MTDQDLGARVGSALEQRVAGLDDRPLTLDDVRRRAHGIRRARRVTAAAVVAAVAAVALPAGLHLSDGQGRSRGVDPAAPTPRPGAAVLHDGVVALPGGRTVPVPPGVEPTEVGVLDDGRVLVMGARQVVVLAGDGSVQAEHPVLINDLTMGEADRTAAWLSPDHRVQVLESGAREPVAFAGVPMAGEAVSSIDAVVGSGCASGGCRVLGGDFATTTVRTTPERYEDLRTTEPLRVRDVSPDGSLWAVDLPPVDGEQFGCSALYDPAADRVTARTCATSGLRFAPDGEHLLGTRGDNNMVSEVVVLDRDLQATELPRPDGQVVSRAAWADATHLLVSTVDLDDDRWSLLRVPIDGGPVEVLEGPAPGGNPEATAEYLFSG